MQAIVIDPQAPVCLGFQTVEPPMPQINEAVIRVKAISLRRSGGAGGSRWIWTGSRNKGCRRQYVAS